MIVSAPYCCFCQSKGKVSMRQAMKTYHEETQQHKPRGKNYI